MGQRIEQVIEWECDFCDNSVDNRGGGPASMPIGWKAITPGFNDNMDIFCSWACVAGKSAENAKAEAQRQEERRARRAAEATSS